MKVAGSGVEVLSQHTTLAGRKSVCILRRLHAIIKSFADHTGLLCTEGRAVETIGVRPYEVSIEAPLRRLQAFDVTFEELTELTGAFVPIAVLVLSLIESLLVLPRHLAPLPDPAQPAGNRAARFFPR